MARELTKRTQSTGRQVAVTQMTPLNVSGVGKGSQQCNWKSTTPVAIRREDGTNTVHSLSCPIVQRDEQGIRLPGLLGLESLERQRAILDCGRQKLYLPGPGDIEVVLPPGSTVVPLQKAPSGHLVMVIDDWELPDHRPGGTAPRSIQLHADMLPSTAASSGASSSSSTAIGVEASPN